MPAAYTDTLKRACLCLWMVYRRLEETEVYFYNELIHAYMPDE